MVLSTAVWPLDVASADPARPNNATTVDAAKEAFRVGMELRTKGDLKGALDKFRQAHIQANTPVTGIELARTHAMLGHYLEAREVCLGIARTPVAAAETQRSAESRSQATRLAEEARRKLAILRLKVSGAPAGESPVLAVDGSSVPFTGVSTAREVNPGSHEISAKAGSQEVKTRVDVAAGESRDVDLSLRDGSAKTTAGPPVDHGPPPADEASVIPSHGVKLHPLVYVGAGVGGAGLLVGLVTGGLALSAKGDLSDRCSNNSCGPDSYGDLDSARTLATVSTLSFVVGILGAGAAAYGYFVLTPKENRFGMSPFIGPTSAGFVGRF